jgi:predicted nucleic acid-binding protein
VFAADTSVVVRVLVGDDPAQQKAALARLRKIHADGGSVVVGAVVLAEVAWSSTAATPTPARRSPRRYGVS